MDVVFNRVQTQRRRRRLACEEWRKIKFSLSGSSENNVVCV